MLRPMSALLPKANIRADEIDVRFVPLPNKVRCSNLQRFIEDLVGQAKLLSKGEAHGITANVAKLPELLARHVDDRNASSANGRAS